MFKNLKRPARGSLDGRAVVTGLLYIGPYGGFELLFGRLLGPPCCHAPGPQGLLRQFWACSEFCSNLRGKVAWSRPANVKQNPCLTDSVRHEFCLTFVFRRIGCKYCSGWHADSFGTCFPVRHTGPQYNVFWLVVEESVGRAGLVPPLIIL